MCVYLAPRQARADPFNRSNGERLLPAGGAFAVPGGSAGAGSGNSRGLLWNAAP